MLTGYGGDIVRYMMIFSYDGTNYQGYQKQINGNTIQNHVEEKLSQILNSQTMISASGRTDAGVHAIHQTAHFDTTKKVDVDKLRKSLNQLTNGDIYIQVVKKVNSQFHARFHAIEKEYIYKINLEEYNPIERKAIYQYNKKLDIEKMQLASKKLIGTHNFKSVTKADIQKNDFIRTIYAIDFTIEKGILTISFRGNGFLRYMVRNLVGLLIEVGNGKKEVSDIPEILSKQDRKYAGITAPPEGLYLKNVKYQEK